MRRNQIPDFIKNRSTRLKNVKENIENSAYKAIRDEAVKRAPNMQVKKMPNYLQVTDNRLIREGVLDLKPLFRRSSKVKYTKEGKWYLRVPIRIKTSQMSSRSYRFLNNVPSTGEAQSIRNPYLFDRRKHGIKELDYTPRSNMIRKEPIGKNRSMYVAYRTVNGNSPPTSWLVGRDSVREDNTSKTFRANIGRLMKWKARNGF